MIQEPKRFLSYHCPVCRQSVVVERDLFSLAAAPTQIPCPCGKSSLGIEFLPDRVRLDVPCLFCGKEHSVSCSSHAFLRERALAFSCSASGLDCCYVGEEGAVYAATARLEQAVDKLEQDSGEKGAFLDELIMHEILSEVREIASRGGISCSCGSKDWGMQVNYSSVDIKCGECRAEIRIPAITAEDIDDICCQYTIELKGKGGN